MRRIYTHKGMVVFERQESKEYVVYNSKKEWDEGHTHIRTYKQAQYLVDCVLHNKVPKRVNKYFIVSLIRLSNSKKYTLELERALEGLQNYNNYHNKPKNFRK